MEKIAVVDFVHLTITYEEEPNMKVATDIGGTFTDLVAIDENGSLILEKAHTTPPNFDQGDPGGTSHNLDTGRRKI